MPRPDGALGLDTNRRRLSTSCRRPCFASTDREPGVRRDPHRGEGRVRRGRRPGRAAARCTLLAALLALGSMSALPAAPAAAQGERAYELVTPPYVPAEVRF